MFHISRSLTNRLCGDYSVLSSQKGRTARCRATRRAVSTTSRRAWTGRISGAAEAAPQGGRRRAGQSAVGLAHRDRDCPRLLPARIVLGIILYSGCHMVADARALYRSAALLARRLHDPDVERTALLGWGQTAIELEDFDQAKRSQ